MDLAPLIDHTCLSPDATRDDIDRLCDEAVAHGFHSVCVAPARVERAAARLAGSPVCVVSVVGFPHGNTLTTVKGVEAESVLARGAREVDMVASIGALRDGEDDAVAAEIAVVADVVRGRSDALLKVILEVAFLSDEEIVRACRLCERAGAHFVKTSTGFGPGGATVAAVRLMRKTVGQALGVKAAGGIRDAGTARAMVEAGASRIGSSSSVAIVSGDGA
jgi:deoxyribose-phosphate aldolase